MEENKNEVTINGDSCHNRKELKVYKNNQDWRGEGYVKVSDLGELVAECIGEQNSEEFIVNMLWNSKFVSALERFIEHSYSPEFTDKKNVISILSKAAEPAALNLISALVEKINKLENQIKDSNEHIKELVEQWPDSYKKYIPHKVITSANNFWLDLDAAKRLLELSKEKPLELDIPV